MNTDDYWAKLTDEDILPCGFWEFWVLKEKNESFLTMKSFETPNNYKAFDWVTYFKESNSKPVPFKKFSEVSQIIYNK